MGRHGRAEGRVPTEQATQLRLLALKKAPNPHPATHADASAEAISGGSHTTHAALLTLADIWPGEQGGQPRLAVGAPAIAP